MVLGFFGETVHSFFSVMLVSKSFCFESLLKQNDTTLAFRKGFFTDAEIGEVFVKELDCSVSVKSLPVPVTVGMTSLSGLRLWPLCGTTKYG